MGVCVGVCVDEAEAVRVGLGVVDEVCVAVGDGVLVAETGVGAAVGEALEVHSELVKTSMSPIWLNDAWSLKSRISGAPINEGGLPG